VTVFWSRANPYCAPPAKAKTKMPRILNIDFLTMAPDMDILLFSQTISSGYGAL